MKRYTFACLWFLIATTTWSCIGNDGLPGPQGPPGWDGAQGLQGPPGPESVASVYELGFDLNADNDWYAYYEFPPEDEIYLEDVVLVYFLWDVVDASDGGKLDLWRLMPVNFFYDEGFIQIGYDYTVGDVTIFAESSLALDAELDRFDDCTARIVVIPAAFSPNARKGGSPMKYDDYEEVKKIFNLPDLKRSGGKPMKEILENYQRKVAG